LFKIYFILAETDESIAVVVVGRSEYLEEAQAG
jgi:hypothetical protein